MLEWCMHLYGYAGSAAIVYSGNPNLFSAFGFLARKSGVRSEPGLKQPAQWSTRVVAKCAQQRGRSARHGCASGHLHKLRRNRRMDADVDKLLLINGTLYFFRAGGIFVGGKAERGRRA